MAYAYIRRKLMKPNFQNAAVRIGLALSFIAMPIAAGGGAPSDGSQVVVVYNSRLPESRDLANYYAQKRTVPTDQVIGFSLPTSEQITRHEFESHLQIPLVRKLEKAKLLKSFTKSRILSKQKERAPDQPAVVAESRIRYLVLCHGVPVKIANDPNLKEDGIENMRPEFKRNEAAIDSELALLPAYRQKPLIHGPLNNPVFGITNATQIIPSHGVLMVARLDGPSPQIARSLIDKALQSERNGLWGRAYFDLRGIKKGEYKIGDDWLRDVAKATRQAGWPTYIDEKPATLAPEFPLSQVGLYAGWYHGEVNGPFKHPTVDFMPGAIAYHLHSYSAVQIRTDRKYWVGPLLARGVTATMGCTAEPYLVGSPDIRVFFTRLLMFGFTFGEAALASQSALSWQTTIIGDPLYQPFGKDLKTQHLKLLQENNSLAEWSYVRVVNLNLYAGRPTDQLIKYLQDQPLTARSPVMQEKLGGLFDSAGQADLCIQAYEKALMLSFNAQQKVRLILELAPKLSEQNRDQEALNLYDQLLKEMPDYPNRQAILQQQLALANEIQDLQATSRIQAEIDRINNQPDTR